MNLSIEKTENFEFISKFCRNHFEYELFTAKYMDLFECGKIFSEFITHIYSSDLVT